MNIDRTRPKKRSGFTLVEVIVATVVMVFMMISLLNFVPLAGGLWQKTHQTLTLAADGDAVLDTLERELSAAKFVSDPLGGAATTSYIIFTKTLSDYQATASTTNGSFKIHYNAGTGEVNQRLLYVGPGWASGTASGTHVVDTDLYTYTIARHIKNLEINRKSNNLIDIYVTVGSTREEASETRTLELKRSLLLTSF